VTSTGAAAPELDGASAVEPDPSAAAFFDVDNTMMVGASIFHFAKGMAARKFFTWRDLARFTVRQIRLRVRGETHEDLHSTRDSALPFVAGKRVSTIVTLGEQIYDEELAGRIWSGTHALAKLHLGAGQRVWLVTATPVELATIIARRLELTGALGTVAESRDGVYTGLLVGDVLHGEAKARAVRQLAVREGLDLTRCSAYSDSINDVPMLSLVGHPVAVNPDSALRAEASRRGWEIRDFRTARKAARVGIPAALGVGAIGGGVAAAAALGRLQERRLQQRRWEENRGRRAAPPERRRRMRRYALRRLLLVAPLDARLLQQLAVLLLGHPLAPLLDDRTHAETSSMPGAPGRSRWWKPGRDRRTGRIRASAYRSPRRRRTAERRARFGRRRV
jgi:HAD superfamily hydrolase (TIGR01490 family)